MTFMISILFLTFSLFAHALEIPTTPPNACYQGCNKFQEKLNRDFFKKGILPSKTPTVFSGACHHIGLYNPDHEHYSIVLLDTNDSGWRFSAMFAFFEESNSYREWTLERARKELAPYWENYEAIKTADETARVVVYDNDGIPVYYYWMRQDPKTKELLLISYMGPINKAFCRLTPNPKQ